MYWKKRCHPQGPLQGPRTPQGNRNPLSGAMGPYGSFGLFLGLYGHCVGSGGRREKRVAIIVFQYVTGP